MLHHHHWRFVAYATLLTCSVTASSQTPAALDDPLERQQFAARVLAVVDAGCVPLQNDGHSEYFVSLALEQLFPGMTDANPENVVAPLRSTLSYATAANYLQINPCASAPMQAEFHRLTSVLEKYGEHLSEAGITPSETATEKSEKVESPLM